MEGGKVRKWWEDFFFATPLFFPVGQQKFPGQKSQGALCPPCPPGQCPPETSDCEISADLPEKERRGKEKRENGAEKKENLKMAGGKIENGRRKSYKMMRGLFFFFFFFFFHFSKPLEFVLGLPRMGIFYREKSISGREKKSGEMTLPPLKNVPLTPLHPAAILLHSKRSVDQTEAYWNNTVIWWWWE